MKVDNYSNTVRYLRLNGYREATELISAGDFFVHGDLIAVWLAGSKVQIELHFLGEALERFQVLDWKDGQWLSVDGPPTLPEIYPNCLETDFGKILPGDYIVHHVHGVGEFLGIVEAETVDQGIQPYISLGYAGNDRLLVPLVKQQELMPYIGSRKPRLTRLYSQAWARLKARVQIDLVKVARELLKIYAARQLKQRAVYGLDQSWLDVLDQGVNFELTPDQSKALMEVQSDLTTIPVPMDRLLCGDVGFGKTEVALRAAAIVLAAGKQVALLAPTTILVEQHYALLQDRFKDLPVKLARLSRMTKLSERQTVDQIATGAVDLVVGTHKLLHQSLEWHDLGLLIIDEEQKFGVAQKEKLKSLRPTVDCLSLSATPIPRTLSMSLSGLRGLSLLRRAPAGRLPVTTIIEEYTDGLLAQAVVDEVKQGGQVYIVQNRVKPLPFIKQKLTNLLQEAGLSNVTIGIAHGQLPELELAQVMSEFMHGQIQVLIASTIVENGLDSPNANTLIVLRSEWFGLSDLYQLRGRVGRRQNQAKAYFLLGGIEHQTGYAALSLDSQEELQLQGSNALPDAPGVPLTKTARQRLLALKEAEELGSGWTVALRDLEIRGGGNVLGNEQSGNMEAVGLLLYGQLLQEEIGKQARKQGIVLFQNQPN